MKIYNYHPETFEFICESLADESPLEPGVFLIPANATDVEPLPVKDGYTVNFVDGAWKYNEIPAPAEEPEEPALTYVQLRALEYPSLFEYLDGIVKGDQAQIDKYIADCLAVKAKYPKPLAE